MWLPDSVRRIRETAHACQAVEVGILGPEGRSGASFGGENDAVGHRDASLTRRGAVDGDHPLMVATELTADAGDQGVRMGWLEEVKETFDEPPERGLPTPGIEGPGLTGRAKPAPSGAADRAVDAPGVAPGYLREVLHARSDAITVTDWRHGQPPDFPQKV